MSFVPFSKKQLQVLSWWTPSKLTAKCDGIICDGAVRSGKTLCMSISFVAWAMLRFKNTSFAVCGKTIKSVKRNVAVPLLHALQDIGFDVSEKISSNLFEVSLNDTKKTFYLFGGRDESSAALIQGMTLGGVLFDEVVLMPRSFVEQAIARCSLENSKLWFNCNPEYPQHWFHREWIQKTKEKNICYIHFTIDDNPSLSQKIRERYKNLYSGSFYDRFVLGKWVATEGLVYPFMSDDGMFCDIPKDNFSQFDVSCDYGTVNPASFGLWGLLGDTWYRIREYYYNSRVEGSSRTDEEHYSGLCQLIGDRKISTVVVDPSAASFIEVIRRHGKYTVKPAKNNVLDGIRQTSTALKQGKIKICKNCRDSISEFGLYRWDTGGKDSPVKENDHAMDDIRYFVTTVMNEEIDDFFVFAFDR